MKIEDMISKALSSRQKETIMCLNDFALLFQDLIYLATLFKSSGAIPKNKIDSANLVSTAFLVSLNAVGREVAQSFNDLTADDQMVIDYIKESKNFICMEYNEFLNTLEISRN